MDATRPLPATGKVAVVFGMHSTECRLSLPAASTKALAADELAPHGWLTVGHLPADTIALQVDSWLHNLRCCYYMHMCISAELDALMALPKTRMCGWIGFIAPS